MKRRVYMDERVGGGTLHVAIKEQPGDGMMWMFRVGSALTVIYFYHAGVLGISVCTCQEVGVCERWAWRGKTQRPRST